MTKTLLLATLTLPSAPRLAAIAARRRWATLILDQSPNRQVKGPRTYYGGTDTARQYAATYDLALIEPPLDLLSQLPYNLLWRNVRCGPLTKLTLPRPLFVKPADPLDKCFDVGTYHSLDQLHIHPLDPATPILVSDPVEFTAEFRCFVAESRITAWSPYLSFGRPIWKPSAAGTLLSGDVPPNLLAFFNRLRDSADLPPAFVVDIGVLDDGRLAVVEFNPAWCSGILGANVAGALQSIERSALWKETASIADLGWTRQRRPSGH